jgi:hypothetical protein
MLLLPASMHRSAFLVPSIQRKLRIRCCNCLRRAQPGRGPCRTANLMIYVFNLPHFLLRIYKQPSLICSQHFPSCMISLHQPSVVLLDRAYPILSYPFSLHWIAGSGLHSGRGGEARGL